MYAFVLTVTLYTMFRISFQILLLPNLKQEQLAKQYLAIMIQIAIFTWGTVLLCR